MLYNVVLHSGVQQSESVIHIHISTLVSFIIYFYFWLGWVFVAICELFQVAARGSYSRFGVGTSHCYGFSRGARALECVGSTRRVSSCSTRA